MSIISPPPPSSVRGHARAPLSTDCSAFERLLPAETLLFAGTGIAAGTFACATYDPLFRGGIPSTSHCIVFSRTPVWIQHDGGTRYVADPTVITFHSRGLAYRRWRVSALGDRCDWVAFDDNVVRDALSAWLPAAADAERVRFPHQCAAAAASLYARQRRMFDQLALGNCDRLAVEEQLATLLCDALTSAFRRNPPDVTAAYDAVQQTREIIAHHPAAFVSLSDLAHRVGLSRFQLCRAFTRLCGESMTAYRLRLRLLASLELLATDGDLTSIALSLGFCSHSHFTAAFRRAFGSPPSQLRHARRQPRDANR